MGLDNTLMTQIPKLCKKYSNPLLTSKSKLSQKR
jgi:hypothetical protein